MIEDITVCEKLNLLTDAFINDNEVLIKQVFDSGFEYNKNVKLHDDMYSQNKHIISELEKLNKSLSNKQIEYTIYYKTNEKVLKKPFLYNKCQSDINSVVTCIRTFAERSSRKNARILLKFADLLIELAKIENERNDYTDKHRKLFDNFEELCTAINELSERKRALFEQLVKLLSLYAFKNNHYHIQLPLTQKEIVVKSYDDYLDYIYYILGWFLDQSQKFDYIKLQISTFEERLELLSKEKVNIENELSTAKMKLSKLKTHLTNKFEKVRNDYTDFADFLKKSVNENYKSLTDIVSNLEDELKDFVSYSKKMRIRYKAAINDMNEKLKSLSNSPPPSCNFS